MRIQWARCCVNSPIGKGRLVQWKNRCFPGEWSEETDTVPVGRTGCEPAKGSLQLQGVKYVLHTVGLEWPASPTEESSNGKVKAIREAISHALVVAETLRCRSVTLPPISGGVFAQNNERAEQAARRAVVSEVNLWASRAAPSTLKEVHIVDKSISVLSASRSAA